MHEPPDHVITTEQDLFAPFEAAFAQRSLRIGLEHEKVGLHTDGSPLRYHGENGVQIVFAELAERYGWTPDGESADSPPIALLRNGASITLEPGSQLELSGAPHETVHAVVAEAETHRRELASLTRVADLHWLGLGFHPFAQQSDLDWVPKGRYVTMREYLPTRGRFAIDMMRRTCTVQANFDIRSEADAMKKARVSLALSPLVQALFANSAVYENVLHPIKSRRAEVWLDVDPDRSGLLPFLWSEGASLGDYVRWALDVPMFIIKRNGQALRMAPMTFRAFLANGHQGERATLADWEMHLNTLFPEVRLKKTLEVRSADGVPSRHAAGLPALWTGVLYNDDALDAAGRLVLRYTAEQWESIRPAIAARGLGATIEGVRLGTLCRELLTIASQGLAARNFLDENGRDERIHLAPLEQVLDGGFDCIGDAVLGDWTPDRADSIAELIERARY